MTRPARIDPNDILNKNVGRLTVCSYQYSVPYYTRDGRYQRELHYYACKCSCGNTPLVERNRLRQENVQSCGCLKTQNLSGPANPLCKGAGEIPGFLWSKIQSNAKARNLSLSITCAEIWSLFEHQQGRCALSGDILHFGTTHERGTTASLDRIDSTKGYTLDNVQWVHKDINQMKGTLSVGYFRELCCRIAERQLRGIPAAPKYVNARRPNQNWRGCGDLSTTLYSDIKNKAKSRGLLFDLSIEQAWDAFCKQEGLCALTGQVLCLDDTKGRRQRTASLDRIDNTLGYTASNIQWVHKDINWMKYTHSMPDLLSWAHKVYTLAE